MKKIQSVSLIIIPLVIIIPLFFIRYQLRYSMRDKVKEVYDINVFEQKSFAQDKIIYEYIYRPSCQDCKKVRKTVVPALHELNKTQNVITLNVDDNAIATLVRNQGILHTPSILVKRHNKTIYQYQGTNKAKWKKIVKGINPTTNKKFQ